MRRGDVKRRGLHVTIPPVVTYIDDIRKNCAPARPAKAGSRRSSATSPARTEEQKLRAAHQREDGFFAWSRTGCTTRRRPFFAATELLRVTSFPRRRCANSAIIGRQVAHMRVLVGDLWDVPRVTRGLMILSGPDVVGITQIEILPLKSCAGRN